METYRSSAEATADRTELKRLASALNAAKACLRLDECRAWHLKGRRGHIATWGNGKSWLLFVQCRSARHWTATKARLSFCRVTQDGDEEGVLRLDRLPTKAEAAAIRKTLGVRQSGPSPANAFQSSSANKGFRALEPAEAPSPVPIPRPAPKALKPPFCRRHDHLPHHEPSAVASLLPPEPQLALADRSDLAIDDQSVYPEWQIPTDIKAERAKAKPAGWSPAIRRTEKWTIPRRSK